MNVFITLLFLSVSLSMDAFAISIFLGTILSKKNSVLFVLLVGIFHFILPILGSVFGYKISSIIELNGNVILGIILLILSIQVFINLYKSEDEKNFTTYEIILLAFSVAIDSFGVGFALSFNYNNIFIASTIFCVSSILFTYLGLLIGKYSCNILGVYAKTIGGIILLIFSLYQLI